MGSLVTACHQVQRGRVAPLKIVQKYGQRVVRRCKHANQAPERYEKTILGFLGIHLLRRWLRSDDLGHLGQHIENKLPVGTQRFLQPALPVTQTAG